VLNGLLATVPLSSGGSDLTISSRLRASSVNPIQRSLRIQSLDIDTAIDAVSVIYSRILSKENVQ
jgi:hypothetical protein